MTNRCCRINIIGIMVIMLRNEVLVVTYRLPAKNNWDGLIDIASTILFDRDFMFMTLTFHHASTNSPHIVAGMFRVIRHFAIVPARPFLAANNMCEPTDRFSMDRIYPVPYVAPK
mmetsp:Transcript_4517/g.5697  ORF Transcript_4517/g.5697 Transcript_4517/m.5697 type:complete len:115 (-) Transcript_4517:461-805(-)